MTAILSQLGRQFSGTLIGHLLAVAGGGVIGATFAWMKVAIEQAGDHDAEPEGGGVRHGLRAGSSCRPEYQAKRAPLRAEYEAKRARFEAEYWIERAPLDAEYEGKESPPEEEYWAKRRLLSEEYAAKQGPLYAKYKANLSAVLPTRRGASHPRGSIPL